MKLARREINYPVALWRRRWWIAPFVILGAVGALVAFSQMTPVYQTQATVVVIPQTISQDIYKTRWRTPQVRLKSIEQEIQTTAFLERVAAELQWSYETPDDLKRLGWGITVIQVDPETYFFRKVGVNPQEIARRANTFARVFVDRIREVKVEVADTSLNFLRDDIARMEKDLNAAEERLALFQAENRGNLPADRDRHRQEQGFLRTRIAELDARIDAKSKDRDQRLEILQRPGDASVAGLSLDPVGRDPRFDQIRALQKELDDLKLRYTVRHPDVVRAQARLDSVLQDVRDNPTPPLEGLPIQPQAQQAAGATEAQNGDGLSGFLRIEVERIEEEIEELRSLKASAAQQIAELEDKVQASYTLGKDLEQMQGEIRVIETRLLRQQGALQEQETEKDIYEQELDERYELKQAASIPLLPFKPDLLQLLLIGIGLGAAAGVGLALLLELLDSALWTSDEVEELLGVSVLAVIPDMDKEPGLRRRGRRKPSKPRRKAHA